LGFVQREKGRGKGEQRKRVYQSGEKKRGREWS